MHELRQALAALELSTDTARAEALLETYEKGRRAPLQLAEFSQIVDLLNGTAATGALPGAFMEDAKRLLDTKRRLPPKRSATAAAAPPQPATAEEPAAPAVPPPEKMKRPPPPRIVERRPSSEEGEAGSGKRRVSSQHSKAASARSDAGALCWLARVRRSMRPCSLSVTSAVGW
jgi:hypothetical protein